MRWFGAGWPDYTWLFGTDGEYTAYAAVAAGQFDVIKDHLRALRDVSEVINPDSGKIVHEVTPDGAVFFGADADAGQHRRVVEVPLGGGAGLALDRRRGLPRRPLPGQQAGDGVRRRRWTRTATVGPRGSATSSAPGMGEEKLDNAVYTIRGYADLADMARAVGRRRDPALGD